MAHWGMTLRPCPWTWSRDMALQDMSTFGHVPVIWYVEEVAVDTWTLSDTSRDLVRGHVQRGPVR
jgi:hypothetical protein